METSAAAVARMKRNMIWPSGCDQRDPAATKATPAPFSMISIETQNKDEVTAHQQPGQPQREQDSRQNQSVAHRNRAHHRASVLPGRRAARDGKRPPARPTAAWKPVPRQSDKDRRARSPLVSDPQRRLSSQTSRRGRSNRSLQRAGWRREWQARPRSSLRAIAAPGSRACAPRFSIMTTKTKRTTMAPA